MPPQLSLLIDPGANPAFTQVFRRVGHLTLQRDPGVAALVATLLEDPAAWTRTGPARAD